MADIEREITRLSTVLEDTTYEYQAVSERAAEHEAEYRHKRARMLVALIEHSEVRTAQERDARCDAAVATEHKAYLLSKHERDAVREALASLRTRLEALRTLAATARYQTSHS